MTIGGWITMVLSLLVVWGGCLWCFRRVLQTPEVEQAPVGFGP